MRDVAIIGSGVAGLVAAHGLRRSGHAVTLYSDRSPAQWLAGRPTGTAARFEPALAYERELGLDQWHDACPPTQGARLVYSPTRGVQLASLIGRQREPALAIDVRLQSHRWMQLLEQRGGRVVLESVTRARLDAIAAAHELTIVATGKGELAELFPRDAERSGHTLPQRRVAMVTVVGPPLQRDEMPFTGVKNNILEGIGEAVWLPYFHRDAGPCWNLIFEAKPGGPMDVFGSAATGTDALAAARHVITTLTPWDAPWAESMQLADELGWLVGAITPTVRSPIGRLPSGRVVTCLGDAAMLFDPLAAQGANNGEKMARHLVAAIDAHADRCFDAAWMQQTFDVFWASEGAPAYTLTSMMLAPMSAAGRLILLAQAGSDGRGEDGRQRLADLFAAGMANPRELVELLGDPTLAKRRIAEAMGRWWPLPVAAGLLRILAGQASRAGRANSAGLPRSAASTTNAQ